MTTTEFSAPATDVVRWNEPDGIAPPRGTLVVLPGRGETADVYRRFATRLSVDAYRVAVFEPGDRDIAERVRELAADPWAVTPPLVLVGSDSGALQALDAAVGLGESVAAVIAAGVPVGVDTPRRMTGTPKSRSGPDAPPPTRACCARRCAEHRIGHRRPCRRALSPALPDVPVLAIHGNTDRLSPPVEDALAFYRRIPNVTVKVVEDGRHDALNDATHRSAAATVVLFLERLRLDPSLKPIVRDVEVESA